MRIARPLLTFQKIGNLPKIGKIQPLNILQFNPLPCNPDFIDLEKAFENTVGKKNAGDQHFLNFPQSFLSLPKQVLIFHSNPFCHLQMLSI